MQNQTKHEDKRNSLTKQKQNSNNNNKKKDMTKITIDVKSFQNWSDWINFVDDIFYAKYYYITNKN